MESYFTFGVGLRTGYCEYVDNTRVFQITSRQRSIDKRKGNKGKLGKITYNSILFFCFLFVPFLHIWPQNNFFRALVIIIIYVEIITLNTKWIRPEIYTVYKVSLYWWANWYLPAPYVKLNNFVDWKFVSSRSLFEIIEKEILTLVLVPPRVRCRLLSLAHHWRTANDWGSER